jgi:hypothetical protein
MPFSCCGLSILPGDPKTRPNYRYGGNVGIKIVRNPRKNVIDWVLHSDVSISGIKFAIERENVLKSYNIAFIVLKKYVLSTNVLHTVLP